MLLLLTIVGIILICVLFYYLRNSNSKDAFTLQEATFQETSFNIATFQEATIQEATIQEAPFHIATYPHKPNDIPNIIWTTSSMSSIEKHCMETWRLFNPTYTIRILKEKDLSIVSLNGGFWLDANVVCKAPLSWIKTIADGYETFGIYTVGIDETTMMIQDWCFACRPNSEFINAVDGEINKQKQSGRVRFSDAAVHVFASKPWPSVKLCNMVEKDVDEMLIKLQDLR